ncbi:FBP domain-containing protein [Longispora albida]|uniref:FBP domain-containing protein n=1 Tax=Longispora albida TaxID=203523 RepID=UPI00036FEC20|nr:FBP domain-containing protein [Longispora albida]
MTPLSTTAITKSFVNCSQGEAKSIAQPPGLLEQDWDALDYLGWFDPKAPGRAVIVAEHDGRLTGIVLRPASSEGARRGMALCNLCQQGRESDEVLLFTARKAGKSGRQFGNSVGTYICTAFACSALATDREGLRHRLGVFLNHVLERDAVGS